MPLNEQYTLRPVRPEDATDERLRAMAQICADGRIRAYGIKPGGPDYALGVTQQLSEDGLEELRVQIQHATADDPRTAFWVIERADKSLAGLCIAQLEDGHVYLDRVFVAESDEGHGIASEALEKVIEWANGKPIKGEVVQGNERALGLYTRRGFVVTGPVAHDPNFPTELERVWIERKPEAKDAA